ncbi:MAG TPA: hypothetical protein VGJ16_10100 [Pirellulales bacterium]|jgi:hypothetical protein
MMRMLRNLAVVSSLFAAAFQAVPMPCALGLKAACAEPQAAPQDAPRSCCQDHAAIPARPSSQPLRPSSNCCCVQTRVMVPKPSTGLVELALAPLTIVSADLSPHELIAGAIIIEPRASARSLQIRHCSWRC